MAQIGAGLPFVPHRYFVVSDVPSGAVRGGHASRSQHELLTCVAGSCTVDVDCGDGDIERFVLDDRRVALLLPPLWWNEEHSFSPGAVLLVLASAPYDPSEHCTDRTELRALVARVTHA